MHIKTGDTVVLLTGRYGDKKDANGAVKTHKVIAVSPKEGKVIVEGVNMIHKHVKPRKQGDVGGIVDAEGAIYASKVALYCPKCNKGVRVKTIKSVDENGTKTIKLVGANKGCGHTIREEVIKKGGKN